MRRQLGLGIVAGALLAVSVALPAAAGGWASVVDDRALPPDDGGTTLIRFTLLQHGQTPVDWGELSVVAVNEVTGGRVTGTASPEDGVAGGWVAAFHLPEAGSWTLEIRHPDLEITASHPIRVEAPAAAGPVGSTAPASPAGGLGVLLLALALGLPGAAALALAARRRSARGLTGPRPETAPTRGTTA
jgi:hypothetical protein